MMKLSVNGGIGMGDKARHTNMTLIIRRHDNAVMHYDGNKQLRAFSDEDIAGED